MDQPRTNDAEAGRTFPFKCEYFVDRTVMDGTLSRQSPLSLPSHGYVFFEFDWLVDDGSRPDVWNLFEREHRGEISFLRRQ